MLKLITAAKRVENCRREFIRRLKSREEKRVKVTIGHPGASRKATVAFSPGLGIWRHTRRLACGRYLNSFGLGDPSLSAQVPITCEINFPREGIDRRMGGLFAEDRDGKIFILHRGRFGGGRKGSGKELFRENYRGVIGEIEDGELVTAAAVVGELSSPRLPRQVAQFVRKVALLKEKTGKRQMEIGLIEGEFQLDLVGSSRPVSGGDLAALCDHDLLVEDLAEALRKAGRKPVNDPGRDLILQGEDGEIRSVYEISAAPAPESLERAASTLLWNNALCEERPGLVVVLPAEPDGKDGERLARLGISWLIYRWQGDRAVFLPAGDRTFELL